VVRRENTVDLVSFRQRRERPIDQPEIKIAESGIGFEGARDSDGSSNSYS
jgi:hypothetical protein